MIQIHTTEVDHHKSTIPHSACVFDEKRHLPGEGIMVHFLRVRGSGQGAHFAAITREEHGFGKVQISGGQFQRHFTPT